MNRIIHHTVFWLIFLSFLPLVSLFINQGMPFVHDGQDHVARIANFYQSLAEGNLVPRWAANLNWGYGHPILMFLYPLPSYMASLFHMIGFSFVDSTKLVFGVSYIASALAMYLWMKTAFGAKAGVIGALLYMFAPYRFVDLYVRGAIGEHVAFIFPPLILYFLFKIARQTTESKKQITDIRYGIGLSVSFAALILAHNAIALMFLSLIFLYMIYLFVFEVKSRWLFTVYCLLFTAFGLGLSAFFWVPAFFEGKYTLRDIVTAGEAVTRFVPWSWFFYSPWNYGGGDTITKSLGFVQWFGVVAAVVAFWKLREKKIKTVLLGALIVLGLSLFIMTAASRPVWESVTLLQKFQFPWRFLSVSVFAAAVLGGISISSLIEKYGQKAINNKLLIAYCLLTVVLTSWMWHPKGYQLHDESFYSGIYPGTTDTGESSPIWSTRFMEHTPATPLDVIDGEATVTLGPHSSTVHEYILNVKKPTLMMENTVYFPGWKIYVDGVQTGIQFQNPDYRGLMLFQVTQANKNVRVVFEDTNVRALANMISGITIGIVAIVGFGPLIWRKRT